MTSSKSKTTVIILNALLLVMMLLATGSSAIAAPPLDGPYDAQSTTGPVPPPGIEREELSPPSLEAAEVKVLDVPAYIWHNGCGPTAAGMVIGYWDGNGFDNLVSGSADTQTPEVNAMISSSGNYDDYCLPIDSPPDLLPDKSESPEGDEHPDDCVADLMKTSQSFHYNYYGWSWFSHVDDALQGYVPMVAPEYSATAENQTWGTFTWSSYRAEIDAGRPVVLLVDTDGDGGTDHFVTAIGYSDEGGTNMYACRNTWDTGVHWFEFAQMASGQPWGIFGATLFQISTEVGPVVYDSHTVDDDNSDDSSGNDDGIVDPGETIELYVDLYNQGSGTATGVAATISTSDPYVSWLFNTSSSYPDISGGGTGTNSNDFDFEVASSTPDGHLICFDLDITSSNGGPWSDSFCVAVGGWKTYLPIVLKNYTGWVIISSVDFEGTFPGAWDVFDNNGSSYGEYYWNKRNCRPCAGSYSGWAVGGGADGAALSCGSFYPYDADSWMVYGPFSLAGANASDLQFKLWLNTELHWDSVCRTASINGVDFYGSCTSGDSGGWTDRVLDLANVPTLGNLLGQSSVWIAVIFDSDSSINDSEGAYVDDITLRKCTRPGGCVGGSSAVPASEQGQTVEIPAAIKLQR